MGVMAKKMEPTLLASRSEGPSCKNCYARSGSESSKGSVGGLDRDHRWDCV